MKTDYKVYSILFILTGDYGETKKNMIVYIINI